MKKSYPDIINAYDRQYHPELKWGDKFLPNPEDE